MIGPVYAGVHADQTGGNSLTYCTLIYTVAVAVTASGDVSPAAVTTSMYWEASGAGLSSSISAAVASRPACVLDRVGNRKYVIRNQIHLPSLKNVILNTSLLFINFSFINLFQRESTFQYCMNALLPGCNLTLR